VNAVDFGIPNPITNPGNAAPITNPILTMPNAKARKTCLEICILHPLFLFSAFTQRLATLSKRVISPSMLPRGWPKSLKRFVGANQPKNSRVQPED
ncbi:MAG: hypothetical protein B7Z82_09180, partial [Halothiobacillus sp. 20-54-6]